MAAIYNYECDHPGCDGYQRCQEREAWRDREEFWRRWRSDDQSIRDMGTDPIAALEGDPAEC